MISNDLVHRQLCYQHLERDLEPLLSAEEWEFYAPMSYEARAYTYSGQLRQLRLAEPVAQVPHLPVHLEFAPLTCWSHHGTCHGRAARLELESSVIITGSLELSEGLFLGHDVRLLVGGALRCRELRAHRGALVIAREIAVSGLALLEEATLGACSASAALWVVPGEQTELRSARADATSLSGERVIASSLAAALAAAPAWASPRLAELANDEL